MSLLGEQKVNAKDHLSTVTDDAIPESKTLSSSDPFISSDQSRSRSVSNRSAGSSFLRSIDSKIWITALILPFVPIVGFAIWLPFNGRSMSFESKPIGNSNLTQVQAKVIDFFCSAVIAPCVVNGFNYLWFSYARVLAVNEILPKGGVPIEAMASTSSTDSGSFNFIKVWGLIKTRKWTFSLFGLLILLSGSTKSLLSNVIAYEASSIAGSGTQIVSLQSLAAAFPLWTQFLSTSNFNAYKFSSTQQADFSSQYLSMLVDLTFHSGAEKLESKDYIGINATTASLNAVPSTVGYLSEVPGYRLSIDCRAETPTGLSITSLSLDGNVQLLLFVGDDPSGPDSTATQYYAGWTGGLETAFGGGVGGAIHPFAAFTAYPNVDHRLYLGFLSTLPLLDTGVPSPYGELKHILTDQTSALSSQPDNVPKEYYVWGISCKVTRQIGFHKLERTGAGPWKRVADASRYEEKADLVDLRISNWVWDLGFRAPRHRSMPGLGPVFAPPVSSVSDINYETVALNALYAIGETNQMLHEVGMQSAGQNGIFQVSGTVMEQLYHMAYVPLLVLASLLACLCACLITFGLLVYHWRKGSRSFRIWRKVTVTRLLADAVDGLRDEDFHSVSKCDNTALEEWSEGYNVRYVKDVDESGISIKLKKA